MIKLNTKHELFQFKDGLILDVSKIDYITENPSATKYLIQINGHVLEMNKDDEFKKLIETWDYVKCLHEKNVDIAFQTRSLLHVSRSYLQAINLKIKNIHQYLLTK